VTALQSPAGHPLVSVLVATYNSAKFLPATIDSVLAQTFSDFELIVVDDGSTDDTASVLEGYRDDRLKLIRQPNLGASAALVMGLRSARGLLIALLDSDDLWQKHSLAAHVNVLHGRPDIDLTFSWFQVVDEAGVEIGLHSRRFEGKTSFRALLADFVIAATSNVIVRRSAIDDCGGIDPAFPRLYDLDLVLRVAHLRAGNIEVIPRDLMRYRRRQGQLSRNIDAIQQEWQRLLDKLAQLSPNDVTAVRRLASSNMNRYFARLAYESAQYRKGLGLLRQGFAIAPVHFLVDRRNWLTAGACISGLLLPQQIHYSLERLAGLRRPRSS
jgi:glycosyltransferase involved in cell wall biosynthesis